MKTWKLTIRFIKDGAHIERTEWGKTAKPAFKTLQSIYGAENIQLVAIA